ncbi:hypothetical protein OGAPHI_006939 [Ogataea philodendri]|uniref:J domain-containing protein n=1 Tax=Ogataea philodendri TaxID=1378263 RepID=A0A9P8NU14_9ASCO|nr:uncharacterized protein OGAPHI_006939 [Ogataea philodendri]KAH3660353.1 hypothetical protein OGAPHI_006939 [Ogataea philodendri]
MKVRGICVFTALFGLALSSIDEVDQRLSQTGASLEILQDYDAILADLRKADSQDPAIANVLYKHGLVNFSLKRDRLALQDFQACLEGNPKHQGCLDRFAELCLEMGEYDLAHEKGIEVSEYQRLEADIVKLYEKKKYTQSIKKASELIQLSPANMRVRKLVVDCLKKSQLDFNSKVQQLVDQYTVLVNNERDVAEYSDLFDLQLFGKGSDFGSCSKILKTCLKYDNDYAPCRDRTKMTVKMNKFLELFNQVSIYYSYLYSEEGDLDRVEELEPTESVWKQSHELLFGKVKARSGEKWFGVDVSKPATNLDLLVDLSVSALEPFGFSKQEILENSAFLRDLSLLAKESCARTGTRYRGQLKCRDEILPEQFKEIDKLISKKQFNEAKQKLDSMRAGFKKSSLWKQRDEPIQKHRENEQRQRHYQQQRQYQQQQQQQRQYQQYQQMPPQRQSNGVDPYKVLGVSKDADEGTIKKAYREKMKQNHPDKLKNSNLSQDEIESKVAEINNAYETLSDPQQKQDYDDQSNGGARFGAGGGFGNQMFQQNGPFQFNFQYGSFGQKAGTGGARMKRKPRG